QAREAGIEALRLRLLLEILALLAVRPEAPEDHEGVADAGEDRAAAEGLGDWGDEVRHYSPPANPVNALERPVILEQLERSVEQEGGEEGDHQQCAGARAGAHGDRLIPGEERIDRHARGD